MVKTEPHYFLGKTLTAEFQMAKLLLLNLRVSMNLGLSMLVCVHAYTPP